MLNLRETNRKKQRIKSLCDNICLNSKNFGVPQNRERVFIIGHIRTGGGGKVFPIEGENGTVINQLGNIVKSKGTFTDPQRGRVYSTEGISPCLNCMQGDGLEPKILEAIPVLTPDRHGVAIRETEDGFHLYRNDKKKSSIQGTHVTYPEGKAHCLSTAHVPMTVAIPVLTPDRAEKRQNGRRFKTNGEPSFTLTAQDRHGVAIREATKKGYAIAETGDSVNLSYPGSKTRRGRVGKGIANTIMTGKEQGVMFIDLNKEPKTTKISRAVLARYTAGVTTHKGVNSGVLLTDDWNIDTWAEMMTSSPTPSKRMLETVIEPNYRIRKLTPRECWRLQGFPDWAFERAREAGVSESQLYKQAGNSVTVNVIKAIGERL